MYYIVMNRPNGRHVIKKDSNFKYLQNWVEDSLENLKSIGIEVDDKTYEILTEADVKKSRLV